MQIGFEFIWDETPLLIEVALYLYNIYNVEIIGVTLGNRWKHLLKNKPFRLVSLSDFLKTNWNDYKINKKDILKLEKEYGKKHDLWFFISVDRLLNDVNKHKFPSRHDKLKLLILHFKFWEKFFDMYKIDGFYTTGTAFLGLLTGMAVAQKRGINFKGIYTTRSVTPRIVFVDNYYDDWKRVKDIFKKLKVIPNKERKKVLKEIREIKNKKEKPSYMKHSWHISKISFPFINEFFRRLKYKYIYKWGLDRFDYVTPPPSKRALKEVKIILKRKILLNFYFKKKDLLREDEDFVFVPLQLQPEESVDIWGKYYSDQVVFIENVSKSLPLNLKLYVKEHSVAVGKRAGLFTYYKRLEKLPNVKLIHPFEDSHKYIEKCKMIILISGTVGWEGLIYEKPVITFGNVFYNMSGLVYHVTNWENLKVIINKILRGDRKINKEKLLRFYYAVEKGSYPGYFNVPHHDSRVNFKNNIINVAKSILKDINHYNRINK